MGEKFTDGSIIQHLSKMRLRREAEGKPCPPPLRRSNTPAVRRAAKTSAKENPTKAINRRVSLRKKANVNEGDADLGEDEDADDELGEETTLSEETKDLDWYIPEGQYPQQQKDTLTKQTTSRTSGGTKVDPKVIIKAPKVGHIPASFNPTNKTPRTTANDDSDSPISSLSDSEDRLCVGFPFLELPGMNSEVSNPSRSSNGSDDSEDQPIANTRGKKIVSFKVPSERLRNLQETGHVNREYGYMQAAMASGQEINFINYDQGPNTTVPGQATMTSNQILVGFDEDLSPFNRAGFPRSQGGITSALQSYQPFNMTPGEISAAAHGWKPMTTSGDSGYGQGYRPLYGQQQRGQQQSEEKSFQQQMSEYERLQEQLSQRLTPEQLAEHKKAQQKKDDALLAEFIEPKFLTAEPCEYPDVPDWTGMDTRTSAYKEKYPQESEEPAPAPEPECKGPVEWKAPADWDTPVNWDL